MLLERWRARRALATRTAPTDVDQAPDPAFSALVEDLRVRLGADSSLGDPIWHHRWEGDLQLVALDCRKRSVVDLRQRLVRTAHEIALRHMASKGRRLVAVVLCAPEGHEGLAGWLARLDHEQGETDSSWPSLRRRMSLALVDEQGGKLLATRDEQVRAALAPAGFGA